MRMITIGALFVLMEPGEEIPLNDFKICTDSTYLLHPVESGFEILRHKWKTGWTRKPARIFVSSTDAWNCAYEMHGEEWRNVYSER